MHSTIRRAATLWIAAGVLASAVYVWAATSGPAPAALRAHFHALLDRPPVPPDAKSTTERMGDLVVEHGSFHSEATQVVPFLAVKFGNATGRLPVVIVLHGTGGSKQGMIGTMRDLAARGMMGFAIDARYHGERVSGGAHGSQEYQEAIIRAWHEKD